jgi:transposase
VALTAAKFGVHPGTIRRWLHRDALTGSIERQNFEGGRPGVLNDAMQMSLLLYITAYPDSYNDECVAYLCLLYPALVGVVATWHISRATAKHRMTYKVMRSLAAERNELDRQAYWSNPLPLGVNGVHVSNLVDTDECGIFITSGNRTRGRAFIGQVQQLSLPHTHTHTHIHTHTHTHTHAYTHIYTHTHAQTAHI